ncbi:hypothetical protein GWI33_022843 [Rhynchophorus ferrugineus]|uniref:Exocyst complex component 3 n=1 Tax=Rhynchophorus ferrugineus TaxID=354439 RepID=A0A834IRP2_RHYFE|nr:hypothetical protein GWI33_022843 [Rhynchophorus ferrugineus]
MGRGVMKEWEATAKESATQKIVNMFNRPGQLEKIDQIKQRFTRKKGSVEALLKSAMQQQLDGVRIGISQLHNCLGQSVEINNNVKKIFNLFEDVPKLCNALSEAREENMKHSQYVTARENLKHIFTVPESVEKTKQWINEGKLLHAHQCLRDLENSRDDLLYEMLKHFRKDPAVIVTALRIIRREEKADELALKQEKQTGFLAPVESRIEGTQVEEREDNKLWLIRYLELIRQLILEDLRVVKTLCVPCFPRNYSKWTSRK